ncbi:hypothetical protein GHT06_003855 [Daphnia sinensis]|uniref:Uncharacterized protein n=1 Tax=Daphnia sinensis TaxID=1820382 RepID=A0AAD5KDU4_9CRUS|nr:hypothetical protein GHT06_003855 [Daphnia sinensis]
MEFEELALYAENNGYTNCSFKWGVGADRTTFFGNTLPLTSQFDSTVIMRGDLVDASRPAGTTPTASYIFNDYTDSSTGLKWRWNPSAGWYLTNRPPRSRWYMFDQKYAAGTGLTDWQTKVNWGFISAFQCTMRADHLPNCEQVQYSPWQNNDGTRDLGYCHLIKMSVPFNLVDWPNKSGITAWSEQSQRAYVKEEAVPEAFKSKGVLVEWKGGKLIRYATVSGNYPMAPWVRRLVL